MTLAYSPEQEELRNSVRRFLSAKSSPAAAREAGGADGFYDESLGRQMADQLGLQGLAIPEEYGGSGFGWVELGIVFEEMGRALLRSPYLATVALAAQVLLAADDEQARRDLLPGIADGSLTATVALAEESGTWELDAVATASTDGRLTGVKHFVTDATANLIIVVARDESGIGAFVVERGAAGLTVTPQQALDLTRQLFTVELDAVPARRLDLGADPAAVLTRALDLAVVALAAEQSGAAERCLEMAVEYAKTREQFGRPIGSFQAIKHKCADMLLAVQSARSAVMYATRCAAEESADLPMAASLAKAYCSDALTRVAAENIQIHGGIGFTWEHDAHLYFRRAKTSQQLFGAPSVHRSRVAGLLGLGAAAG